MILWVATTTGPLFTSLSQYHVTFWVNSWRHFKFANNLLFLFRKILWFKVSKAVPKSKKNPHAPILFYTYFLGVSTIHAITYAVEIFRSLNTYEVDKGDNASSNNVMVACKLFLERFVLELKVCKSGDDWNNQICFLSCQKFWKEPEVFIDQFIDWCLLSKRHKSG